MIFETVFIGMETTKFRSPLFFSGEIQFRANVLWNKKM